MTIAICDLRECPEFASAVGARIWRAWWEPQDVPLSYIMGRIETENLAEGAIPFALVAHEGDTFAGTASVIVDDLDERPQYTPWVAAVWVDPQFRSRGIGGDLVNRAAEGAFAAGFQRVYLNALKRRTSFYEGFGWTCIEEDVGKHAVSVFIRDVPARAGA